MAVNDFMIALVLKKVIKRINNNFDITDVLKDYNASGRTMSVVITDLNEGTGFSVVDGVLTAVHVDEPTCTVTLTKDTLAAIVTNKITQQQAFLMGGVDIISSERIRDSIILNRIFDEMKETIVRSV